MRRWIVRALVLVLASTAYMHQVAAQTRTSTEDSTNVQNPYFYPRPGNWVWNQWDRTYRYNGYELWPDFKREVERINQKRFEEVSATIDHIPRGVAVLLPGIGTKIEPAFKAEFDALKREVEGLRPLSGKLKEAEDRVRTLEARPTGTFAWSALFWGMLALTLIGIPLAYVLGKRKNDREQLHVVVVDGEPYTVDQLRNRFVATKKTVETIGKFHPLPSSIRKLDDDERYGYFPYIDPAHHDKGVMFDGKKYRNDVELNTALESASDGVLTAHGYARIPVAEVVMRREPVTV